MTRDETIKILMIIQAAYPNYKPPDKTVAVNVWSEMLSDIPYEQVSIAVKAYIQTDTSGFAPSIGNIREKVQFIFSEEDDLNESAAWEIVWRAICNSGYHAEEEYNKLPPIVQRAVGSPRQLREWGLMENIDGKSIVVLQSNFQRVFRIEKEREKERKKLSQNIVRLMDTIKGRGIAQSEQSAITEEAKGESQANKDL